eukprot:scaffold315874_cov13-Tisochrysis_lutea.AAC.1
MQCRTASAQLTLALTWAASRRFCQVILVKVQKIKGEHWSNGRLEVHNRFWLAHKLPEETKKKTTR